MIKIFSALSLILLLSACSSDVDEGNGGGSVGDDMDNTSNVANTANVSLGTSIKSDNYSASSDSNGKTSTTIYMASVAFDADGKIMDIYWDAVEAKSEFGVDGQLIGDLEASVKTKKELGYDYDMKNASPIGKEWFEQVEALEKYAIGKTISELQAIPVKTSDSGSENVPDDPDLVSSVTISIDGFVSSAAKAYENGKDGASAE